jgi:Ca2+-binding RTX toxin-like protein
MLRGASSRGYKQRKGRRTVVRQGQLITVVVFLIGCAVLLLVVGCSGVRSGASKKEQGRSPEATESEEARCEGTRTIKSPRGAGGGVFTTNDLPGCPNKGGLLLGTDKPDKLAGKDGDDKIRGLGGKDTIVAGPGNDVIYAGPGGEGVLDGDEGDDVIYGGPGVDYINGKEGEDVIYGGDDTDWISGGTLDEQRDKFYCGAGKDHYYADKNDYVSSSCEKKIGGGGAA